MISIMFPCGNGKFPHSSHLGVMCRLFFRCEAARALLGGRKLGGESALKPVPCSIAPGSLTGTFRPIVPNPTESARLVVRALSVEESRLARRPPRKRRAAAFTPRSDFILENGLNSSEREDIQTMDWQVFRVVFFRRNGPENRVKQMAHSVADRCRSIPPV